MRRLYCFLVGHDARLIAYDSAGSGDRHETWVCRRCPWSVVIPRYAPVTPPDVVRVGGLLGVGGLFAGRGELVAFLALVVVFVVVLVRVAGWWQP